MNYWLDEPIITAYGKFEDQGISYLIVRLDNDYHYQAWVSESGILNVTRYYTRKTPSQDNRPFAWLDRELERVELLAAIHFGLRDYIKDLYGTTLLAFNQLAQWMDADLDYVKKTLGSLWGI